MQCQTLNQIVTKRVKTSHIIVNQQKIYTKMRMNVAIVKMSRTMTDVNDDLDPSESADSDEESVRQPSYAKTSDRVLRPRRKHIDYSMCQKYTDTQLLQIEKAVITKLYSSNKEKKSRGNPKGNKIKKLKIK